MTSHRFAGSATLAALVAMPLAAQVPVWKGTPATSYSDRFHEVWNMAPATDQAAAVKHLVLKRETGEIVLESGTLYLLKPIGGQVMGALFRGAGTFTMTAPTRIEQERLKMFHDSTAVSEPFSDLLLLFADTTLAELTRQLAFGPGEAPSDLRDFAQTALKYIGDEDAESLDADVMRAFLNGEQTGMFYAHMDRDGSKPWMFFIDPEELESVRFLSRAKRTDFTHYAEAIAQFAPAGDTVRTGGRSERRPGAWIKQYTLNVQLPSAGGGIGFSAAASLAITADSAIGPWVPFVLFDRLDVDSARWESGESAVVYKGRKSDVLWVRIDPRLEAGEVRSLGLYYHGDLLGRAADLFYIKSSIAWYPLALGKRDKALFDITYQSPQGYALASVGDRTDSTGLPGHMIQTRWVTPTPIRNASFTIGVFDRYDVKEEGVPPIQVLWSEETHRWIAANMVAEGQPIIMGKNMKEQVGQDVTNAMRFYEHVYGDAPVRHFYATEIPYLHGEAWPGIVGLSYVTFHATDPDGGDQVFRAHEVAHQWWGIAVDYATYHDQWLSEGFADFSGLWYLQTRRKDNGKYFGMLDKWKASIMLLRDAPVPIWLGYRASTSSQPGAYNVIIYKKGAWVLHMLRMLLLDLRTMNEDRFTAVMHDFYSNFHGGAASTADFEQSVERSTGQDMRWFFREWVYGYGIPTYKVASKIEPGPDGKFLVTLRVDQENVSPEFLNYVPVTLDLGNNQLARVRVKVTGARSEIPLPAMPARPKEIRFDDLDGVLAEVKEVNW